MVARRWGAWVAAAIACTLAACGAGRRRGDSGLPSDPGVGPDVIYVIPETGTPVEEAGPDEARTADEAEDLTDGLSDEGTTSDEGDLDLGTEGPGDEGLGEPDEGAEVPLSCEGAQDGAPCDDGEACTEDDRCVGGVCRGQPLVCLDDGILCTADVCEGGVCVHPIKPGYCFIANKCYSDGDINPANQCEYCQVAATVTAWSQASGFKCEDGDPCTVGDLCEDGVCRGGPNQCIPPECTYHADCYPERVCGRWYSTGKAHCSVPCTGPADCGKGETCTHLPGSSGVGYCQKSPVPAGGQFGSACDQSGDCFSTLCVQHVCGEFCAGQPSCQGGTCFPAGDGVTMVQGACAPDSVYPQGYPMGLPCTKGGGLPYDSSLCLSGHCDLTNLEPRCAKLCSTDSQCASGQECNVVLFSTGAVAESLPFAPEFSAKTHDGVLGCYTTGTAGTKSVGQTCSDPSECRTNKCFALVPQNPTKYCTTFCGSDAHCPTGWQCKPELVTLTNLWLQQPFSQPPAPNAYTLVRICKPK